MNSGYGQIDDWFKVVAGRVYQKPTLKYYSRDLVWSHHKKKNSLILKVSVKSKF